MSAYRRNFVPGGCFFTVDLAERKLPSLTHHAALTESGGQEETGFARAQPILRAVDLAERKLPWLAHHAALTESGGQEEMGFARAQPILRAAAFNLLPHRYQGQETEHRRCALSKYWLLIAKPTTAATPKCRGPNQPQRPSDRTSVALRVDRDRRWAANPASAESAPTASFPDERGLQPAGRRVQREFRK